MGRVAHLSLHLLSVLFQLAMVQTEDKCVSHEYCSNVDPQFTNRWYIWLLLALCLLLVACGIAASCFRACSRRPRPPLPAPYELTVITMDHENTLHNTIGSFQSLYIPSAHRVFTVTCCPNPAPPAARDSLPACGANQGAPPPRSRGWDGWLGHHPCFSCGLGPGGQLCLGMAAAGPLGAPLHPPHPPQPPRGPGG
ncbi:transmembrane protein 52B-like [Stegostoma tigrinum]|uniref:transmembrane protein 52B-like n=1 Tax=Stegostoma tigrinum TaxID=3053191 RepID=UPI00286FEC92|nr:transmembrane protein 52B-like [Stegostoma tigrinum]